VELYVALYQYTATDTSPGGTSAASRPLSVELSPTISGGSFNSSHVVTLKGIAADSSGITVYDGGSTVLGTTIATSTGAWSFTTAALSAGSHALTATDSSSGVTSAPSSSFGVTFQQPVVQTAVKAAVVLSDPMTLTATGDADNASTL
jgi:hypothetical protein